MFNTLDDLLNDAIANSGGTYFLSMQRNRFFLGKSMLEYGFYVATEEDELVVEDSALTATLLSQYMGKHIAKLLDGGNYYVGMWKAPSGRWYIDITEHVDDFEYAIALGKERGQQSMWDIEYRTAFSLDNIESEVSLH